MEWLQGRQATFRGRLQESMERTAARNSELEQRQARLEERREWMYGPGPPQVFETRGGVVVPRFEDESVTAKRGASAAAKLLERRRKKKAAAATENTGFEMTLQRVQPGSAAPPAAWGRPRLVAQRAQ